MLRPKEKLAVQVARLYQVVVGDVQRAHLVRRHSRQRHVLEELTADRSATGLHKLLTRHILSQYCTRTVESLILVVRT